jgi:hypothetical protein
MANFGSQPSIPKNRKVELNPFPKGFSVWPNFHTHKKKAIASYDTVEGNQVLRENKWKLDKLTFHYHTIC